MSREVVVDVSVSAAWFLIDEQNEHAERLLHQVTQGDVVLVVPQLWHYEMLNVLRSGVLRGRITERDARQSLARLASVPALCVSAADQGHTSIFDVASESGLSAYDAAYVLLAESRGIDLVTADRGMLALKAQRPWIRSIEEFLAED